MLAKPSFGFNSIFIHVFCRFSSLSKTSAFARYGKAKSTIDHETLIYLVPFYKATASKTIWSLLSNRLFSITWLFCGEIQRQKGWNSETSMVRQRDIFGLTMMALRGSLSSVLIYFMFSLSAPQKWRRGSGCRHPFNILSCIINNGKGVGVVSPNDFSIRKIWTEKRWAVVIYTTFDVDMRTSQVSSVGRAWD